MPSNSVLLLLVGILASQVSAQLRCRFNATAPDVVSYYTCTELAERYDITTTQFFLLNPILDPDSSSIQVWKQYCVAGNIVPTSSDRYCKPDAFVTCLGYSGGQCCNANTWKCGQSSNDCEAGTCVSGLCAVNNPDDYSLDGQCGPSSGNKLCGGKWGSCCGKSNRCGSGPEYCGANKCLYGNCTITLPTPSPRPPPPNWASGNTTNGRCGPSNDYQVCNMVYGNCCSGSGLCGTGSNCGAGCNPL